MNNDPFDTSNSDIDIITGQPFVPKFSIGLPQNQNIAIPRRVHTPVLWSLLIGIATIFILSGISTISSIATLISSGFTTFLMSALGFNAYFSTIIMGLILFIFGILLYFASDGIKKIVTLFINAFKNFSDAEQIDTYEMKHVKDEQLVHEQIKRGCTASFDPDGIGYHVHCEKTHINKDLAMVINGNIFRMTTGIRVFSILFLNIVLFFFTLSMQYGAMDIETGKIVWYIICFLSIGLLWELELLPLWAVSICFILQIYLLSIFVPNIHATEFMTLWAIAIIMVLASAMFYLMRGPLCYSNEKMRVICDRL